MIRHIVFFNAKDPKDLDAIHEGLCLLKGIPDCEHFEIGRNTHIDTISHEAPDFVVYGEFRDEAQLKAYKAHQLYQASIDAVRPLRDTRIAADFLAT